MDRNLQYMGRKHLNPWSGSQEPVDRNLTARGLIGKVEGQARKSLWIEIFLQQFLGACIAGQARKSLWIEM